MRYFDDCILGEEFRSPRPYIVDAREMSAFAQQWDPQPYHLDEEQAATLVGEIFATGLLTLCIGQRLTHDSGYFDIATSAGLGLDEIRMPRSVFAGDQLSMSTTIIEMRRSASRPDMGVMTNAVHVTNQDGQPVLTYRLTSLVHRRPAEVS